MIPILLKGASTDNGLSGSIWGNFPIDAVKSDPRKGNFFFDDFNTLNVLSLTNVFSQDHYTAVATSGGLIRKSTTLPSCIELFGTADNDEISLERGVPVTSTGSHKITAGTGPALCFEARINKIVVSEVADLFIGLGTAGIGATGDVLFTDTVGTMTTTFNQIGFHTLNSGSALTTCLQKATVAERTPVAAKTLVADTFTKIGFRYDPLSDKPLIWYVDGVEVDSITSDTITTFPTAALMNLCIVHKNGGAADNILRLDWWAVGQLSA
jgi:hypothetical protein